MKSVNNYFKTLMAVIGISLIAVACSDFVSIDSPKTEIVSKTVFANDASATSAIRGVYSLMASNQSFSNGEIEKYTGLSSDEFIDLSNRDEQLEFFTNSLSTTNQVVLNVFWKEAYVYINNANSILEGLSASTGVSSETKNQLMGEARFIRAFCHFYLVNLFGDVPYIESSDYRVNTTVSRLPKTAVYGKILEDLQTAKELISDDYSFSNNERIQPNRSTVSAFLARVYLYLERWSDAESEAISVIERSDLYLIENDLNSVFLANSVEAIWQLQPVVPENSTAQARSFIPVDVPVSVSLSPELVDAFEDNDARLQNWIGEFEYEGVIYYYPYKYKVYYADYVTEYATVFRLSEQYLIRAEARAQLDNIAGAIDDVDVIRARAQLPLIRDTNPSISKTDLLQAIQQERWVELFAEWGHRWLDLKRAEQADNVLTTKGDSWQSTDVLYPIPESERLLDTQLSQNLGY